MLKDAIPSMADVASPPPSPSSAAASKAFGGDSAETAAVALKREEDEEEKEDGGEGKGHDRQGGPGGAEHREVRNRGRGGAMRSSGARVSSLVSAAAALVLVFSSTASARVRAPVRFFCVVVRTRASRRLVAFAASSTGVAGCCSLGRVLVRR